MELPLGVLTKAKWKPACPQSAPHPTLLDSKPEAVLHPLELQSGATFRDRVCRVLVTTVSPSMLLRGPCKVHVVGSVSRSLPGVCTYSVYSLVTCYPDAQVWGRRWPVAALSLGVYGCGGEMRPEVTDKYNCKQIIHAR